MKLIDFTRPFIEHDNGFALDVELLDYESNDSSEINNYNSDKYEVIYDGKLMDLPFYYADSVVKFACVGEKLYIYVVGY